MFITNRWALGIAVAAVAFGAACTEVVTQEPGTYPSSKGTSSQQTPATAVSSPAPGPGQAAPAQEPLIADVNDSELARFFSSMPDGRGLPPGSGTVAQGQTIYAAQCAGCHGAKLEGGVGDRLIGGRGSLAADSGKGPPVKTLESYWPYATTLWDYIKRAMPFTNPGSLSNDDVYALTAYILNQAQIVPGDATMNKETLPKVEMPNRNGFRPAGR